MAFSISMADDSSKYYDVANVPAHWSFQLLGHGERTGFYPGWVAPVGILEHKPAVIYNQIAMRGVVRAAYIDDPLENQECYVLYGGGLKERLSGFDFRRHSLFAYSRDDVAYHDDAGRVDFIKNVLGDNRFEDTDPFVRLSIAHGSRNREFILDEMRRCAQYLKDSTFLQSWYNTEINLLMLPEHQLGLAMPDFAAELEQPGMLESLIKDC